MKTCPNEGKTRWVRALSFALLAMAFRPASAALRAPAERDTLELIHLGLDLLMDGDPNAAAAVFRQVQERDPQSPLGYLFEADAVWWKIYYSTANMIDPEVLDVVTSETTPFDSHFEDLVNTATSRARAGVRARRDEARNYLYEGLAYALRARLAGLRGKELATARAGKKMRSLSVAALALDPNLADADLGVGFYNYFEATLPGIVRLLRMLIALPKGDRELGLDQLELVARKGDLAAADTKFYLAKIYSRPDENQLAKSLQVLQELARAYPNNPLWPLVAGSVHCRMGETQRCEEAYREVFERTAGGKGEVKRAVNGAARLALERLRRDEKPHESGQ